MQARRRPYRLPEPHEVHTTDDNEEMRYSFEDDGDEARERAMTNNMIKEQLQKGRSVQYRAGGDSMYPWVHSGDCCLIEPAIECDGLKTGDIVFCQLDPHERYFAGKIMEVMMVQDTTAGSARHRRKYWIGDENDCCYEEHIYGKYVEVVKE